MLLWFRTRAPFALPPCPVGRQFGSQLFTLHESVPKAFRVASSSGGLLMYCALALCRVSTFFVAAINRI